MLCNNFSAKVICGPNLTDEFPIQTGVKQGYLLFPLLFSLCLDWVMTKTTGETKWGIIWTLTEVLEDLDFADDIALLSHRHRDIQDKTMDMDKYSNQIGLNINTAKTKLMKINTKSTEPVKIKGKNVEEIQEFAYLGSKITSDGNSEEDVKARINKARGTLASLKNVLKSTKISTNTKIRIFKSIVLAVLLYGAESWKVTNIITNSLDVFQTWCLRRILRIFWPNTISNKDLYRRTTTIPISEEIQKRRWRWIGQICRMQPDSIPRVALRWALAGKRNRGRPRETWRKSISREMTAKGWTSGQVERWAAEREHWRTLVMVLRANQPEED